MSAVGGKRIPTSKRPRVLPLCFANRFRLEVAGEMEDRMRTRAAGMALVLICGGCGSSTTGQSNRFPESENQTALANSPAATSRALRAGHWEASVSVEAVNYPDIAPQDVEEAKASLLSEYSSHGSCLRADEVHRPPQQFFSGTDEGCSYDRLLLAGGSIGAAMTCQQDFGTHRIDLNGTYTPDTDTVRAVNMLESPDRIRRMSFTLVTRARRIGDC
jgi:hypothetical protein